MKKWISQGLRMKQTREKSPKKLNFSLAGKITTFFDVLAARSK